MTETVLDAGPIPELLRPSLRVSEPTTGSRARHAAPVYVPPAAVRRSRLTLLGAVGSVIYLGDLATKIAVVALLEEGDPVPVGGTQISLRLIRNPGAAFGLGVNLTTLFTALTVLVVAGVLRSSRRLGSRPWALTLGLLLGGTLGNLTDRLARSPGFLSGHVVDFVEIPGWPIFNVADLSICAAGGLMVCLAIRNIPLDGRRCRRY